MLIRDPAPAGKTAEMWPSPFSSATKPFWLPSLRPRGPAVIALAAGGFGSVGSTLNPGALKTTTQVLYWPFGIKPDKFSTTCEPLLMHLTDARPSTAFHSPHVT